MGHEPKEAEKNSSHLLTPSINLSLCTIPGFPFLLLCHHSRDELMPGHL